MFNRFFWLMFVVLLLTACNQPALNAPQNNPPEEKPAPENPGTSLNAVADSYTFQRGALSLVAKENGILSNDTLPQTFELAVSTNPQYGTLELKGDGSFSYQHDGSSETEDTFSYKVRSAGLEAETTVTILLETTASPEPSPEVSPCFTSVQSGQPFECQFEGATSYALENAPEGMVIQQRSGFLRWTPTAHQVGSYTFTVTSNTGNSQNLTLTVTPGNADPTGLYVSPKGSDTNPGSPEAPFKTIQHAVDQATPGTTIYLRGGNYFNPDYGKPFDSSRTSNGIARITISGTEQSPITLRSHGNEFVTLKTDESGLIFSLANYWIVEGLELEGSSQSLNYNVGMENWWADDDSQTSGRGISNADSQHLTVRNCIIHDFPGAGIGSNGADFVTLHNNVIYNNGWWTVAGTHGIANSYLTTTDPGSADQEKLIMTGNLVFGNQSLIISHVFSKGKVALTLDEGNGLHAQNNRKTFQGKARVENNLLLFNGKAGFGINTMDNIIVRNNSFYLNANVVTNAGELTVQSSSPSDISNNLFMPRPDRLTIKDFQESYINVGNNVTTGSLEGLPASVTHSAQVFQAPDQLDFRPASGIPVTMGVPGGELERMLAVVKAYGISITAPPQIVNDTYLAQMKQTIFDTWPAAHSDLILEDKKTGFEYSYAQRCQYPEAPSAAPCP